MSEQDKLFRRHFFAFLKENNAYDKWLYHLLKRHPIEDIGWWDNYNRLLYENKCYSAIRCGFSWYGTVEGYWFWSDLNDNWYYYRNNLIKTEFND